MKLHGTIVAALLIPFDCVITVGRGGQEIGTDIYACQPGSFNIVLDFDSGCNDKDIIKGPGIEEVTCIVDPPIIEVDMFQSQVTQLCTRA
jgi:hypothetical protein